MPFSKGKKEKKSPYPVQQVAPAYPTQAAPQPAYQQQVYPQAQGYPQVNPQSVPQGPPPAYSAQGPPPGAAGYQPPLPGAPGYQPPPGAAGYQPPLPGAPGYQPPPGAAGYQPPPAVGYYVPAPQSTVVMQGGFEAGARFSDRTPPTIPPPPPGVAPNAAQMGVATGQNVVMSQQKSNWMSGGGDGGYTVF